MTQALIRNADVNERTSRRGRSLSNCFKQAIHVPPFDVGGFETRDGKLVYY